MTAGVIFKIDTVRAKAQVVDIRTKANAAKRAVGNLKPIFRTIDKAIDKIVKRAFRRGWPDAPLKPRTLDYREREVAYYARTPRQTGKIGRWTDDMYQGLLGKGVLGRKVIKARAYGRIYTDRGSRGRRVDAFHRGWSKGGRTQRPRPFWGKDQRSRAATQIFRGQLNKRVAGIFG